EATGRNLDVFFDQWLYHAGHPEFDLSWSWDESAKQVELRTKQTQEVKDPVPLFKLSASVELAWPDRTQKESIRIEKADQVFRFDAPRRPRAVLFDPDDTILKKVTFKRPRDELLWQLGNVDGVWPRIDACRNLGKFAGDAKAIEGLETALKKDTFWAVRREAAAALGEIGTTAARDALLSGTKDKDSRVRRGVYRALGNFRKDDVAFKALAKGYREDGWYYPMNAAGLALAETRQGQGELGYAKAESELERISEAEPMSNLRTNARKAIATLREKHAEAAKKVEQQAELDKLKDENKELRSRITAIEARFEAIGKRRKR